jgi:hypothetical protein
MHIFPLRVETYCHFADHCPSGTYWMHKRFSIWFLGSTVGNEAVPPLIQNDLWINWNGSFPAILLTF